MIDLPPRPRILLVRLSAIGDVVHALPVANALRAHFPDAWLGWAVETVSAPLIHGHGALDQVFELPRGWLKSFGTVRDFRRNLLAQKIDIAIDLQGLTKSAIAARLSGAPVRMGYGGVDGREISGWFYTHTITPKATHVIDRNLELLAPLGVQTPAINFVLPENGTATAKGEGFLRDNQLDGRFAIINPGAGWVSKLWPPERFGAVAQHLGAAHAMRTVIVWAGEKEKRLAQEIQRTAGGFGLLAPPTDLPELVALLRRACVFVGSDTGPLHLAVAVDTPSIGLFGPMPVERNGPYGARHIGLQKMSFTGTSRERRNASLEVMAAISVLDVTEACDRLLARNDEL